MTFVVAYVVEGVITGLIALVALCCGAQQIRWYNHARTVEPFIKYVFNRVMCVSGLCALVLSVDPHASMFYPAWFTTGLALFEACVTCAGLSGWVAGTHAALLRHMTIANLTANPSPTHQSAAAAAGVLSVEQAKRQKRWVNRFIFGWSVLMTVAVSLLGFLMRSPVGDDSAANAQSTHTTAVLFAITIAVAAGYVFVIWLSGLLLYAMLSRQLQSFQKAVAHRQLRAVQGAAMAAAASAVAASSPTNANANAQHQYNGWTGGPGPTRVNTASLVGLGGAAAAGGGGTRGNPVAASSPSSHNGTATPLLARQPSSAAQAPLPPMPPSANASSLAGVNTDYISQALASMRAYLCLTSVVVIIFLVAAFSVVRLAAQPDYVLPNTSHAFDISVLFVDVPLALALVVTGMWGWTPRDVIFRAAPSPHGSAVKQPGAQAGVVVAVAPAGSPRGAVAAAASHKVAGQAYVVRVGTGGGGGTGHLTANKQRAGGGLATPIRTDTSQKFTRLQQHPSTRPASILAPGAGAGGGTAGSPPRDPTAAQPVPTSSTPITSPGLPPRAASRLHLDGMSPLASSVYAAQSILTHVPGGPQDGTISPSAAGVAATGVGVTGALGLTLMAIPPAVAAPVSPTNASAMYPVHHALPLLIVAAPAGPPPVAAGHHHHRTAAAAAGTAAQSALSAVAEVSSHDSNETGGGAGVTTRTISVPPEGGATNRVSVIGGGAGGGSVAPPASLVMPVADAPLPGAVQNSARAMVSVSPADGLT